MGFSHVAAAAIIGSSILLSMEILTGGILPTVDDFNDSYDDMKTRSIAKFQTDINITNAITSPNGSNYDLNITVKNTGNMDLETVDFNTLINGTIEKFICADPYLYPENDVYFKIFNLSGTGKRRLKIVTGNGISDYYSYIIT
ncbi:MAG: hypothetical protein JSW62_01410 [Thermoplasmatales archaeon]|nr:MAG: hypothetical protein JSW62_01410 [Thermoplasmatales archaeon]